MRISDWSSDVCSSDLLVIIIKLSPIKNIVFKLKLIQKFVLEIVGKALRPWHIFLILPLFQSSSLGLRFCAQRAAFRQKLYRIRSEERRVGTECVRPCSSRWSPPPPNNTPPPTP